MICLNVIGISLWLFGCDWRPHGHEYSLKWCFNLQVFSEMIKVSEVEVVMDVKRTLFNDGGDDESGEVVPSDELESAASSSSKRREEEDILSGWNLAKCRDLTVEKNLCSKWLCTSDIPHPGNLGLESGVGNRGSGIGGRWSGKMVQEFHNIKWFGNFSRPKFPSRRKGGECQMCKANYTPPCHRKCHPM